MLQIDRLSPSNKILYTHVYHYDEDNLLISETLIGDLGEVVYEGPNVVRSLYHQETCKDEMLRASETTITGIETYFHLGLNEIGIVDENQQLKELRIPGISTHKDYLRPIAIETKDAIYAPIYDVQGNLVKLIDIFTRNVITLFSPDLFIVNTPCEAGTINSFPIWGLSALTFFEYQEKLIFDLYACRHNGEDTSIADVIEHVGNGEFGSAARDVWESEIVREVLETIGENILRDE